VKLDLGGNVYDLTHRPLVVGILNRTRDSFYDRGVDFELDAFLRHAEQLVDDGADVLDVGARPGGVGVRGVNEDEEAELVVESLQALRRRFEVPLSVDTQRATVAAAAFDAGAVLGNDMSGFRDPGYLATAARAGAAVIATHIRLPPGVADPDPRYDDVVEDVAAALDALSARAAAAGIPAERIILDPGYDLGKSWWHSRCSRTHRASRSSATPSSWPSPTRSPSAVCSTCRSTSAPPPPPPPAPTPSPAARASCASTTSAPGDRSPTCWPRCSPTTRAAEPAQPPHQ
jgi:dihydropteroate synthase